MGGYSLKLGASAAATDVCEWVLVGINVYIPNRKYQVKPYSSLLFSAAYALAIAHNHSSSFFFVCINRTDLNRTDVLNLK